MRGYLPLLLALSAAILAVGLLFGLVPIAPSEAWQALFGGSRTDPTRLVLLHVRLPRVIVAWVVGSALAVAGCALQGLFRNPLADPSVLGVSAGGALGAQVLLFLTGGPETMHWLPLAACAGALLATLVVLTLVRGAGSCGMELLVLGGVAVGQVAIALSTLIVSIALADYSVAQRLLRWSLGSLDGRTWTHVAWGVLPTLAASSWVLLRARQLDAMMLGEATALSLGVPVAKLRREVVVAVAILSGVTVAIAGVVGFVGLVVPHLARRWVGASHSRVVPLAWWLGGAVVVGADTAARTVIAPAELQLGAVTAIVGAPWFILVLRSRLREAAG